MKRLPVADAAVLDTLVMEPGYVFVDRDNNTLRFYADDREGGYILPTVKVGIDFPAQEIVNTTDVTARAGHATAVVGNVMYVFGGMIGSSASTQVDAYDMDTGEWVSKEPMPTAKFYHSALTVGTKIYVFGGWNGTTVYDTIHVYDTDANTWTSLPASGTPRMYVAAAAVGTKLYYYGGWNGSAEVSTMRCYDTDAGTWTTLTAGPHACLSPVCGVHEGQIYIAGGFVSGGSPERPTEAYRYDPVGDAWTTLAGHTLYPSGVERASGCVFNGRLYSFGGRPGGTGTASRVLEYNIATNTWGELTPMSSVREHSSAVVAAGRIAVFGGRTGTGHYATPINLLELHYPPADGNYVV